MAKFFYPLKVRRKKSKRKLLKKLGFLYRVHVLGYSHIAAQVPIRKLKKRGHKMPQSDDASIYIDGVRYFVLSGSDYAEAVADRKDLKRPEIVIHERIEIMGKEYKVIKVPFAGFMGYKNLKEIYLPDTIKYVGRTAFMNCPKLEKVSVSNSNEIEFDEAAFYGCNLEKLQILNRNEK